MADSHAPAAHSHQPTMSGSPSPARTGNAAFITHFMPGLIIGLLVGSLAGAFLPVLMERDGIPNGGTTVKGLGVPRTGDRDTQDERPDQGASVEQMPGETAPVDPTNPATTTPPPPPPPAEPVTTPAKPPVSPK